MKTIFLLRHGHAETKEKSPDDGRNLDETGRKEALLTGEKLLKEGLRPDVIISSHANRAHQTAEIVAETLGFPPKNIQIERDIYYANDADSLLQIIFNQEKQHVSVMISGHNPTISDLGQKLSRNANLEMPTGSVLVLQCNSALWDDIPNHETKEILFFEPEV